MKSNKEVTIYDVAKTLNISPSTVSRGLKDHPHIRKETSDRIKACAREMGYQQNKFASSLRKKRTDTIGVVVPKLNSYFQATAIAGIEKITNQHGYGLLISQSQESAKQEVSCITTLYNSRVDGVIISLAYDTKKYDHFNILFNKDIPIVFFDRVTKCPGCMSVIIDNFKAGYDITTHLIEQGCRRIVHLTGNLLRNVYLERLDGYRQALIDKKIKYDPELLIISELNNEAGVAAARKILKMKSRPDGVFAANDATAVAVICELQKLGLKVPDDIAVAGFNNEPLSQVVQPNLTTIDYPAKDMGEMAATSLINKLNNKGTVNLSTVVLNHELIIRESTLRRKE
jgi:LacI family transcriptional regulator, galactose operon repressor